MLIGVAITLIAIYDPRDEAFPAGRPVVFLAGLLFLLAGLAIVSRSLTRSGGGTLFESILAAAIVTLFGSIPLLLALRSHIVPLPIIGSVAVMGILVLVCWSSVLRRVVRDKKYRYLLYAVALLALSGLAHLRGAKDVPPAPALPTFPEVYMSVEQETVFAGEDVTVTFDGPLVMPEGFGYWVCIVTPDSPISAQGEWRYLTPGTREVTLKAPETPGAYEVRLHPYRNLVLSRRTFLVRDPKDNDEPAERVPADSEKR